MLYDTRKKKLKPKTCNVDAGRPLSGCKNLSVLLINTSVSQHRRALAVSLPNLVKDPDSLISELKVLSGQPPFTLHFTPRAGSDYSSSGKSQESSVELTSQFIDLTATLVSIRLLMRNQ